MDRHQEIDNIDDFSLIAADQTDDNVVLPIELTNTTGTCLQQLNTDCLMEIFSSNSLTLTDLCSIAETCTRFKDVAKMIFPKDLSVWYGYNRYSGDSECKLKSTKYGEYWCSMLLVERILKNFGPYVSAVSMKGNEHLKLVTNYCDTGTLQRLNIRYIYDDLGEGLTSKLKSIFQRMLALSFKHCYLMKLVPCPYINCDSLIELEIKCSSHFEVILRNTFPNLERFTFHSFYYCDDDSEILPNFLRRHKRIGTLNLSLDPGYCSTQLMETITDCTVLTNLILGQWEMPMTSFNFANLKNLSKLTTLALTWSMDHRQLIALLEVLQSLTRLKLRNLSGELTEVFSVLPQLPNLRELHLEYGVFDFDQIPWSRLTQLKALYIWKTAGKFSPFHLLRIIRELINLEELEHYDKYFYTGFILSSECFSAIVKIVERRPNKLTLRCHLSKALEKNYVTNKNVNLIGHKHPNFD